MMIVLHCKATCTSAVPKLNIERSISADAETIAYRAEKVFCLFRGDSSSGSAVTFTRRQQSNTMSFKSG